MDFCRFCRARLEEFSDGQLPASEREKVAAHLESCADCARALGELESQAHLSRAALGELAPAPAPPDLRLKVRAALQNETARRSSPWRFPTWPQRWNPAKFAWSGGITFAAIALVILARPDSPDSLAPVQPSLSPPPNRETASAPSLAVAPPRAKPKAVPQRGKNAPRLTAPPPEVRTDAAGAKKTAKTPSTPAPAAKTTAPGTNLSASGANASESEANPSAARANPTASGANGRASLRALRRARTAREPKKAAPDAAAPPPPFRAPVFPSRMTRTTPPPQMAAPSTRPKTASNPPSPRAVPPPPSARFRAQPAAPSAIPRPVETPAPPRFLVALSAVASPQSQSLAAKSQNAGGRAEAAQNLEAAPQAAAPPPAPQALRDETENRAAGLSRSSAPARALRGADAVQPPRFFQLSVSATRALQNAQIRLVLPPQVRFSPSDSSEPRVLWRGNLGANSPVVLPFALHGVRGGEKISLFVEQKGANGKSQVVETQILIVPASE